MLNCDDISGVTAALHLSALPTKKKSSSSYLTAHLQQCSQSVT